MSMLSSGRAIAALLLGFSASAAMACPFHDLKVEQPRVTLSPEQPPVLAFTLRNQSGGTRYELRGLRSEEVRLSAPVDHAPLALAPRSEHRFPAEGRAWALAESPDRPVGGTVLVELEVHDGSELHRLPVAFTLVAP